MVKCVNCGFLAARNMDTRELEELDGTFREYGRPPLRRIGGRNQYKGQYDIPLCFVQAVNFYSEVESMGKLSEPQYEVKSLIEQDRQCDSFVKWQQGFTPKEHREMLDRKEMLKWQARREASDKAWRATQEQVNRKWRIREFIIAVVALFIIVVAAIVGAIIERGGQPTINIITPNPESITIEHQP